MSQLYLCHDQHQESLVLGCVQSIDGELTKASLAYP